MQQLGVDPDQTLAMEDSGNGWLAAQAAGLKCVVTVNDYTRAQDFSGADLVVSEFGEPGTDVIDVLQNPHQFEPLEYVTLDHLKAVMS